MLTKAVSIYSILDIPEPKRDSWYPPACHEPIQNGQILIFDIQTQRALSYCLLVLYSPSQRIIALCQMELV